MSEFLLNELTTAERQNHKCVSLLRAPTATRKSKGVFLVTTTIAFVSFERDLSMNTDS